MLDIKSAFFPLDGEAPSDNLIKGKPDVIKYLIADGFTQLKVGGFDGKQKGAGCQYVQPCILTPDGQTRVVFGSGTRETCGALMDRFRMGEQIKWTPWGTIASIVRVEKPLASHYEWVSFFQAGNFAGVKQYLDKEATYYLITHTIFPESPAQPRFNAVKFEGQEAVFKRLDNEMSRQVCISPYLTTSHHTSPYLTRISSGVCVWVRVRIVTTGDAHLVHLAHVHRRQAQGFAHASRTAARCASV